MLLVPVIDLMRGEVVRAVRGDRQHYRPIRSALCAGSDPVAVARALCRHAAARHLYAADLDALLGGAPQVEVLRRVLLALPDVELWLDAGFADPAAAATLRNALGAPGERVVPVFGSESLRSVQGLPDDAVLSLDRRDGRRLDAAGCWEAPQHWPQRVIVMTLERVGAASGPDLETFRAVQQRSPGTKLIGAGGVRDDADLRAAAAAGAHAWLVASALHDGRIRDTMALRPS